MPGTKKGAKKRVSNAASLSRERVGGDDSGIPASTESSVKRLKTDYTRSTDRQQDADGSPYWELSQYRRVGVSNFKDMTLVNIREYYPKDGTMLPGQKGISLTIDQFKALTEIMPALQKHLGDVGQASDKDVKEPLDDSTIAAAPAEGQWQPPDRRPEEVKDEIISEDNK